MGTFLQNRFIKRKRQERHRTWSCHCKGNHPVSRWKYQRGEHRRRGDGIYLLTAEEVRMSLDSSFHINKQKTAKDVATLYAYTLRSFLFLTCLFYSLESISSKNWKTPLFSSVAFWFIFLTSFICSIAATIIFLFAFSVNLFFYCFFFLNHKQNQW